MPTLNRYAETSNKNGYYIRAYTGGDGPITLQVSSLAARIFNLANYPPGKSVPSKLVWSMYDLGLVYTLDSVLSTDEEYGASEVMDVLNEIDLDSSLSADEEQGLVDRLHEYNGPNPEEVEKLIDRLQRTETIHRNTAERVIPLAMKWADEPTNYEKLQTSLPQYEEFVTASLRTFVHHPRLSAPPIKFHNNGDIEYKLSREERSETIRIRDCRYRSIPYNYEVCVKHSNNGCEIGTILDSGRIATYTNQAGKLGFRMRFESMLEWILPSNPIEVDLSTTETKKNIPDTEAESDISTSKEMTEDKERISLRTDDISYIREDRFNHKDG